MTEFGAFVRAAIAWAALVLTLVALLTVAEIYFMSEVFALSLASIGGAAITYLAGLFYMRLEKQYRYDITKDGHVRERD